MRVETSFDFSLYIGVAWYYAPKQYSKHSCWRVSKFSEPFLRLQLVLVRPEAPSCSWRQMAKAALMLQSAGYTRLLGKSNFCSLVALTYPRNCGQQPAMPTIPTPQHCKPLSGLIRRFSYPVVLSHRRPVPVRLVDSASLSVFQEEIDAAQERGLVFPDETVKPPAMPAMLFSLRFFSGGTLIMLPLR